MKNNKGARHVLIMTATIDPSTFKCNKISTTSCEAIVQLRLNQYLSAIKFYIQESAFTDIIFVENSLYEFDYKKYEDMARTVGKTFEYLPMKLSERQLGFMDIIAKTYGEALLIDYAMRNGKAVAESDEIYKVTGRVLFKNSDKIIRRARKGVSEAICLHSLDLLKIFPCCKHLISHVFLTVFFKVTKADYFAVFGKDIYYYEKLLTTGQGKYMIIERLWYELAKKDKLRIYSFKCYPDLSGNRGSANMAYDKNKVSLFFRNILCKFGYYSLKS